MNLLQYGHDHERANRKVEATAVAYRLCVLVLCCRDRSFIPKINRRVDDMIKAGLLDEAGYVNSLSAAPTARQAIGYKEFAPYFAGKSHWKKQSKT